MRKVLFALLLISFPLMGEIQAVLFDYEGVLAKDQNSGVIPWIRDTLKFTKDEIVKAIALYKEEEEGEGFWKRYAQSLGKQIPADFDEMLEERKTRAYLQNPGVFAVVRDLKRRGVRCGLFTNMTEEEADYVESLGHLAPFDPIILSYMIEAKKPKKKAFRRAVRELGFEKSEVLIIDDKKKNVEAAEDYGCASLHFKDVKSLRKSLKKYDLL